MNQEIYDEAIRNGCSERLAEMFACQRAPSLRTTSTFLAGRPTGGDQFSGQTRDHYLRAAEAAGVSVTGKVYDGRLAAFPGDPEAWIEGPDDVRRVVEQRGWTCDGDVKVKGPDVAPAADVPLAADIVEGLVERRLEREYGDRTDEAPAHVVERATADVMDTHAAPWSGG